MSEAYGDAREAYGDPRTDAPPPRGIGSVTGPEESIRETLTSSGAVLVSPADVRTCTGTDVEEWESFSDHWERLSEDKYAAERGTRRLRRYGIFEFHPETGDLTARPQESFIQPKGSNPLYLGVERKFDPLTDDFAATHVLRAFTAFLGRVATVLERATTWTVKVHPLRVVATEGSGEPTPEGLHRDGVTLVSSLLVARNNVTGGESTVTGREGQQIMATTLEEPGTLLLGDDRVTQHGVSPVRPADPAKPAYRDVLVVTFAPPERTQDAPRFVAERENTPHRGAGAENRDTRRKSWRK